MKYCSILGPPRPNLEKGAGTRLPAAFSRKLGPVLERQLTAKPSTPLPPATLGKKPKNQWKSKLRSGGLPRPIFWPPDAILDDFRANMGPKWTQNGVQNGSKKGPRQGIWFWTRFSINFHWFLSCFLNDFSMLFWIVASCEWKMRMFRITAFLW